MTRDPIVAALEAANKAAEELRTFDPYRLSDPPANIGIILGTGWGDAIKASPEDRLAFGRIPGFEDLYDLEGHAREVVFSTVMNRRVIALIGRVHLNEDVDNPNVSKMVRLQVEMLLKYGVKTLIITSAVGALPKQDPADGLRVGNIALITGVSALFCPTRPLYRGEFAMAESALDPKLSSYAIAACPHDMRLKKAKHVMYPGPDFEGRSMDKDFLGKMLGADVVGMSMLPELRVVAAYRAFRDPNVRALGLGFVTNDHLEEHSHETNQARAKEARERLGALLTNIIDRLPE